jgi:hypothetical protein
VNIVKNIVKLWQSDFPKVKTANVETMKKMMNFTVNYVCKHFCKLLETPMFVNLLIIIVVNGFLL